MAGSIAATMMFVCLLVVGVIVGAYVAAYAANCFLTVAEGTAAGNDAIHWPDEPFLDWLWKFVYFGWLIAVWLMPTWLVGRWLLAATTTGFTARAGTVAGAGVLWLVLPISLLSSMSASSPWIVLSPALLPRLGRRPGALIAFYLSSAVVLAAGLGALYLLLVSDLIVLVPVAALILTGLWLIYARLFGRLAHLLRMTEAKERPRRKPSAKRPRTRAAAVSDPWGSAEPVQPRDLPPVMTPYEGPLHGYDVRYDDAPPEPEPATAPRRPPDLDDVPYEMSEAPPEALRPGGGVLPKRLLEPTEYEMELARIGKKRPGEPEQPWLSGTWTFPLYQGCWGAWAWLTLGVTVLGSAFRLMAAP